MGLSRFSVLCRSCGFQRHSSSQTADVIRVCDRGSELDHASPASFSVAFRYRFRLAFGLVEKSFWRGKRIFDNAHGIALTLRSFNPVELGEVESSSIFQPRLLFHERPPRSFFSSGDRSPVLRSLCLFGPIDQGRSFQLPGSAPARSRLMADLRDRLSLAALGFSCCRSAGRQIWRAHELFELS